MHDSKIIKSTCGKLAAIVAICVAAAMPSLAETTYTDWTLCAGRVRC